MTLTFQNPLNMLIATHHLLIPMNPSLKIPLQQMTKTFQQMTFFKTHQTLILLQILPHITNKFSKLLILFIIVKEPVTHLKTNLHLLILQIVGDTKTHYNQRQQPKKDYCLFTPLSKL